MKIRTFAYHFLFWATLYFLWIVIFFGYSVSLSKTVTIEFCYLVFITADYYAISYWVIPGLLRKGKYAGFILSSFVIITLSAYLRALVAIQMNVHFFHTKKLPGFGELYLYSVVNIALWALVIITGKMIMDRRQTHPQLAVLEAERIKNELDYLKAQINPHALFNSINTIYAFIDKNNPAARKSLLQFSELLRYQLYDCNGGKVCLEKEIDYIKNYIDFQRLRSETGLAVAVQIDAVSQGLQIVPLLLVVLLENAFKFVSNFSDRENEIRIRIFTKNNILYSSIFNTREEQPIVREQNSGGIGIVNLKRRLALLYPGKNEFTTTIGEDFYEAKLTIDLA